MAPRSSTFKSALIFLLNILFVSVMSISASVFKPDIYDGLDDQILNMTSNGDYVFGDIYSKTALNIDDEKLYNVVSSGFYYSFSLSELTEVGSLYVNFDNTDVLIFDEILFANTKLYSFSGNEALTLQGDLKLTYVDSDLSLNDHSLGDEEIIIPDYFFQSSIGSDSQKFTDILKTGKFYICWRDIRINVKIAATYDSSTPIGEILSDYCDHHIVLGNSRFVEQLNLPIFKYLIRYKNNPNANEYSEFKHSSEQFFRLLGYLTNDHGAELVFKKTTASNPEQCINVLNDFVTKTSFICNRVIKVTCIALFFVSALLFLGFNFLYLLKSSPLKSGWLLLCFLQLINALLSFVILFALDSGVGWLISSFGLLVSVPVPIFLCFGIALLGFLAKDEFLDIYHISLKI